MRKLLSLAIALTALLPVAAHADSSGRNSTPGTLECGSVGVFQSTSGSPAARAIQLSDQQVFVFKGSPDLPYYQGQGTAPKWITCTLNEPGPGGVGTLTVVGVLTPR